MKIEYLGFIDVEFAVGFIIVCSVASIITLFISVRNRWNYENMKMFPICFLIGGISFAIGFMTLSTRDIKDGFKDLYGIELNDDTVGRMIDYNSEMTDFVPAAIEGTENSEFAIYSFSIEDGYISLYKRHGDKYVLIEPTN